MEYRALGASGLKVSAVGLGTNNFGTRMDLSRARPVVDEALELGVNFIDTADIYGRGGSETILGELLGTRRQEVVIATKVGMPMSDAPHDRGGSRRWLMRAIDASLSRLKTDYVDLYQVHAPDPATPILETLQALDDLVTQGKVRYVGHSNFAAWQAADAHWTARTEHLATPISSQLAFNLLERQASREALPACRRFGLGLIPYSPLASGFLSGKYRRGVTPAGTRLAKHPNAGSILTEENFARLDRLDEFARRRERTLTELAFGWLLSHQEVSTVIAGASTAEQVRSNVAAMNWRLSDAELQELSAT
jgi:aryl-alcohol dehydrogenase-like predicted oxidoreductase